MLLEESLPSSTKVFTNTMQLLLFALTISDISTKRKTNCRRITKLPNILQKQLVDDDGTLDKAARLLLDSDPPIFIGRGGYRHILPVKGH